MNNTLKNGFILLEYLAGLAEERSVKELAEVFQLPNSHIHRLLKTLTETGYVEQSPANRKYRVSLKILNLANARLKQVTLRRVARPYGQQLAREVQRPVYLSAAWRGRSLVVDTEYPEAFYGDAGVGIGQLHNVNLSACGKVCAAYADDPELDALLAECDWTRYTPTSVASPAAFRDELARIREQGYACLNGERHPNMGAVGAPIFGADQTLLGAVGVVLPEDASRWTPELWERYIARTRACAESISFASGCAVEPMPFAKGEH